MLSISTFFVCSLSVFAAVQGFYSSNDDVVQLDPTNFDRLVIQSSDVWLVEFYASWCGRKFQKFFLRNRHFVLLFFRSDCQNLVPEWKRAASALKGIVKVGAVDADTHKSLGQQYGVQGFPTIKVFGANKRSPTNYQGGRTADAIVEQALTQVRQIVNERLGKRGSSGTNGGSGNGGKDTIDLTDSNFQVS